MVFIIYESIVGFFFIIRKIKLIKSEWVFF